MSKTSAIDWRSIPRIQKDIEQLNALKDDPDRPFGVDGPMKVDEGRVLTLTVKVTDPELAQVVLSRAFSPDDCSRVPGMVIEEIGLFPEKQRMTTFVKQLRELADDIEEAERLKG